MDAHVGAGAPTRPAERSSASSGQRMIASGQYEMDITKILRCALDFACGLTPANRLNLMKKSSASTLSSFLQRIARPGYQRGAGRVHG
jgi:hypothetical protein